MIFAALILASKGDRDPEFQKCLSTCISKVTETVFLWSIEETCSYDCMWQIVHQNQQKNIKIEQYYGKWPFYRVWFIQEPMSMLFSFLNLLVSAKYYTSFKSDWKYANYIKFLIILNIVTWLASMSLHTISNDLTERLDYFSAGFVVVYGLFLICIYLFKLSKFVIIPFTIIYSMYVKYQIERSGLDYGLHMLIFSILGIIHNFIWLVNSLYVRTSHALKCGISGVFTLLCLGLFEWLDFAYIGYLDAHALWHLSTLFVAKYWYGYWLEEQNHKLKAF
eukprot:NODE_337_length_9297_cov_0.873994.p4 type:complete len:278 gc:universal NODE_337_length_9297_cov_0.873994:1009-176(-)